MKISAWAAGLSALAVLIAAAWLLPLPAPALDWQAGRWLHQPWRLWTCTLVHGNAWHAAGNALAALLLAALGRPAALSRRALLGWLLLAVPLAHALLALRPELPRYFGASGALHAAATLVIAGLLRQPGHVRRVGAALALGLLVKLALEAPWGPVLAPSAWLDGLLYVPWAHAAGVVAGVLTGWLLSAVSAPARAAGAPP